MKFSDPIYLIIGAIITIALIMLRIWLTKRNQRELTRFAAARLIPRLTQGISAPRRRAKATLFILGIALLFIALARPQWGTTREEVRMQGIDILIALDTSRSMLASDVSPNRLERSKLAVHDFTTTLGAARIGLLPFAGDAFLLCPLTLDRSAFESSLNDLDTRIIPEGGTDIARAITESEKVFEKGANQKILVLITDGEDLEGKALDAARDAQKNGITIHTVGVGTPSGNLIVLDNGRPLTDAQGTAVKSKLDDKTLREIASLTGGMYAPLVGSTAGLEQIRSQRLAKVTKSDLESQTKEIPIERYQWPLGLALLLLSTEFCISAAARNKKTNSTTNTKAKTAVTALAFLAIITPTKASESHPDPRTIYNEGTELWKQGKLSEAEQKFHDSLSNADLTLQNRAYYNIGNTRYRLGQQSQQKDAKKTIQLWEKSITSYKNALKLNPTDQDAAYNKKLVKKKLEELKKQEKDKQDQKDKKDEKKQDEEKKDKDNKDQKDDKKSDQKKDPSDKEGKEDKGQKGDKKEDDQQKSKPNDSKDQKQDPEKEGEKSKDQQDQESKEGKDSNKEPSQQPSKTDQQKDPTQQTTPGQMTEQEAKRLLESLTNEEGKIRFAIPKRDKASKRNARQKRDW